VRAARGVVAAWPLLVHRPAPYPILVCAALIVSCGGSPAAPPPARAQTTPPAKSAQEVVEEFGLRMKNVPLLAPRETAAEAIRRNDAELVDPDLLQRWLDDPANAPGRAVSSPWPDRIEVTGSSEPSPGVVRVTGEIVEVSSSGVAARDPVTLELRREGGAWRITSVSAGSRPHAASLSADQQAALQVVHDYYAAIAAHDFASAYRNWGDAGAPGQSSEEFAAGFRDTASVTVQTGTPSRVEPAAGSRYVRVPVVVTASTRSGGRQRFAGSYTLRRSVVDGASAADRRWHLDRASLRETP